MIIAKCRIKLLQVKDDSFLPELIEFLEPKPEEKDNGDIPF